ncbi:putative NADH:ubiquinone oxidoreductase, 30kDa subunit [Medicago truncatula]|uniref:Putative NADH:ubiquinone oxidoreductase, 30kDa subunit n=1 Tax=Medicago truncatula TaxID=3880 RepID=A0A396ICU9_MEDTR|nr:putative NADH:ubiquinone oxidoreductase, 30kDa subunit [Medicago truncatula]
MLGMSYDNHPRLKHILMPESCIGWPSHKIISPPIFMKYRILIAH